MSEWIMLVVLLSPGGDYMDKIPVAMPTEKVCRQSLKTLPKQGDEGNPWNIRYAGICVTRDHWEGRRPMKNIPLD